MALTRIPSRVRLLVAAAALIGVAAVLVPTAASATPGQPPQPTVASVTAKLDDLARQNEVLTERYNQAQAQVEAEQKAANAAHQAAGQAASQFQAARSLFNRTLAAQYEGSAFSTTGALLTSQSGQNYLDKVSSLSVLSVHRADVIAQVKAAKTKADHAQKAATSLLAAAKAKRDAVGKQRDKISADTLKFKDLLATLTQQQQQAYKTRNTPAPDQVQAAVSVHAGSAAAQKAVDFALKQVGKAYVFAASGPDAFDCSGLTMVAWAQAGVQLPHLASAQYDYGTHVAQSDLQPGDLIFLYTPITHVEIYIGNNLAVSAADEALGIRIVNISNDQSDYVGATRLT